MHLFPATLSIRTLEKRDLLRLIPGGYDSREYGVQSIQSTTESGYNWGNTMSTEYLVYSVQVDTNSRAGQQSISILDHVRSAHESR